MTPPRGSSRSIFSGKKKKSAQQLQAPETEDEFLAAGVENEETGEKWRAGDAEKSLRAFMRALNIYDIALERWPNSFNIAYNKARLQYQITQHPSLMAGYPASPHELLNTALESHRRALVLTEPSADLLFNCGQVLTSLAEAYENPLSPQAAETAMQLVEEASSLFQKCLVLQKEVLVEQNQLEETEAASEGQEELIEQQGETNEQEVWIGLIQEPTTLFTLEETIETILESLAVGCRIVTPGMEAKLASIEELASRLIQQELPDLIRRDQNRTRTLGQASALPIVQFKIAALEAEYRLGLSDAKGYYSKLKQIFEPVGVGSWEDSSCSAELYSSYADALTSFNEITTTDATTAIMRWSALSRALECVAEATKLPGTADHVQLNLTRGDTEMLRYRLTLTAALPDNIGSAPMKARLLKNAETYYRGAMNLAKASDRYRQSNIIDAAIIKQAIAASIASGESSRIDALRQEGYSDSTLKSIVSEMLEEHLIAPSDVAHI